MSPNSYWVDLGGNPSFTDPTIDGPSCMQRSSASSNSFLKTVPQMPRDDRLYYLKGLVLQKRGDFDPSILISDFSIGYMDSEGAWHHLYTIPTG